MPIPGVRKCLTDLCSNGINPDSCLCKVEGCNDLNNACADRGGICKVFDLCDTADPTIVCDPDLCGKLSSFMTVNVHSLPQKGGSHNDEHVPYEHLMASHHLLQVTATSASASTLSRTTVSFTFEVHTVSLPFV